jgi:hypothetical protein
MMAVARDDDGGDEEEEGEGAERSGDARKRRSR